MRPSISTVDEPKIEGLNIPLGLSRGGVAVLPNLVVPSIS